MTCEDCGLRPVKARSLCHACHQRHRRHGTLAAWPLRPAGSADLVADLEWILTAPHTLEQAAARVGRTPVALERALYRAGRHDLVARMRTRRVALTRGA